MNEFYAVGLANNEICFFRNRDNARTFLWKTYLHLTTGNESDEEIEKARAELNEFSEIEGVGRIYTTGFED